MAMFLGVDPGGKPKASPLRPLFMFALPQERMIRPMNPGLSIEWLIPSVDESVMALDQGMSRTRGSRRSILSTKIVNRSLETKLPHTCNSSSFLIASLRSSR
ncbi:hypothetical protein EUGRSUZ_C03306 [Eucalyptus grandis]|uniref:Uncharacterized protein n=2 Tax=Eucalyptus grandis TaxID=71139 RepID=A0ACC3LIH9_EUCGR|nr:hypothetical protein EUGRSUZ_C03306 [Eucalyptus grandis]